MSAEFLKDLARARPDPGGGAAAAYGARLGLALVEKVIRLEAGRRAAASNPWGQKLMRLGDLEAALRRLQAEDVRAYADLAREKAADSRGAAWRAAVRTALEVPCRIGEQALAGLALVLEVAGDCKKHLRSDLLVATEFLGAALSGACHIARANLPFLDEAPVREEMAARVQRVMDTGRETCRHLREGLASR